MSISINDPKKILNNEIEKHKDNIHYNNISSLFDINNTFGEKIRIYYNSKERNCNVVIDDKFEEPQKSNNFVLHTNIKTFDDLKKVVNQNSKLYIGQTIKDILVKINYIWYQCRRDSNIYWYNRDNNKYMVDLIKVDYKILRSITINKYNLLHKALFRDYDAELFSPLLDNSIMTNLDSNINKLYDVAKDLNYMKLSNSVINKYKTVISDQLNDIKKLQKQLVILNETVDKQTEEIKLQKSDLIEKTKTIKELNDKKDKLVVKRNKLRKQLFNEENKSSKFESKYNNYLKDYIELENYLAELQKNPTQCNEKIVETNCTMCLTNIKKISELESKIKKMESKNITLTNE